MDLPKKDAIIGPSTFKDCTALERYMVYSKPVTSYLLFGYFRICGGTFVIHAGETNDGRCTTNDKQ